MVTAAVGTFWGGAGRFCAVFGCMGQVTFNTFWWFTTEVGGMTKGLAVEALSHGS